jgi:UDP-N-acetylglucosamine 3-dehydrogenase
MGNSLRAVVVVGAGQFGKNHVRVLNELGALGGIVDRNLAVAKFFGDLYKKPWYGDVKDLKGDEFFGAVVATPTTTHLEVAKRLIERGISNVFVEKPFTATLEEAYTLADFAEDHGAKLMVGFIERFNQAVDLIMKMLSENAIGRPIIYHAIRIRRWPERPIDLGVVKDVSIHDIDLVNYLKGGLPDLVYAKAGSAIHKVLEDHVTITLSYRSGEMAIIEANWITPYKMRRFTITGVEGVLEADLVTQEVFLKTQAGSYSPFVEWKEPLKMELNAFIHHIENNSSHSPNHVDAINALKVAEAVLKSSQSEKTIQLD